MTSTFRALVVGPALGALAAATPAAASQFTVNPTRVELSGRTSSSVVTVRNDGQQPIRIQVKSHAWTQTLEGAVKLDPTEDVIVFPTLLTLAPGEERRLRVAVTGAPSDIERTYRIFLEELPPPQSEAGPNGVHVLTRVGIPIFLAATRPSSQGGVSDVGLAQGVLHFQVDNIGNTHFVPETLRVRGMSSSGATVTDKTSDGWYILGHSSRRYTMRFADQDCARISAVLIDVKVGDNTLKGRLETPGGACGR
jgi:fimbrial chaperone protein